MKKYFKTWLKFLLIAGLAMTLATSCSKSNDETQTESGTIKDIDGNVYHTVTLGNQVWMVENLKTTKYRNGDPIPNVAGRNEWEDLTTGAYCNYNNDETIGNVYGRLYNWFAVNDSRKIAPKGWHVPSRAEWNTLENFAAANMGTSGSIAKALSSKTNWVTSDKGGAIGNDLTKNNSLGFNALPGGMIGPSGQFDYAGSYCAWWSSEEVYARYARFWYMRSNTSIIGNENLDERCGLSVRCVKD